MSWHLIEDKHKKKYNRNYIACHEPDERKYLIDLIIEHFPILRKGKVEQAIENACQNLPTLHDRKVFLNLVEAGLNLKPKSVERSSLSKSFTDLHSKTNQKST